MDTTLRSPSPAEPQVDSKENHGQVNETDGAPVEVKPSERVEIGREPQVVESAGIKEGYGTLNTEYLAKKIDSYVLEEMKLRGIKDTKEGYDSVVKEWVRVLKLTPEMDIYTRLEKLKEYGFLNSELREKIDEKQNLLAGDPMKMTSTQLRKLIENV